MLDDDTADGEIRALSAAINYDGTLAVLLVVPGVEEPVEHVLPGDDHTVLLCHDEKQPLPIDLDGTGAVSRRCQELVARGVARLNETLAREHARQERRRREQQEREDDDCGH